mgnify:CR=1 FL=1
MPDHSALYCLTGGEDASQFITRDWGRQMRHWPGSLIDNADFQFGLDSFEDTIAGLNRAHEGWLHFADQSLKPVPADFVGPEGLLDMRRIAAAFSSGQTLYLTKADRAADSLGNMCWLLFQDLSRHGVALRDEVNAHMFLTPRNSQGFAAHRDAHASFILQCEGTKHWKVYTPRDANLQAHRRGTVGPEELAEYDVREVTLHPNDVLYIPEWWPHEAAASSEHSLHVTLRAFPLRWCDLIGELADRLPSLAAPLPTGTNPDEKLAAGMAEMLEQVGRSGDLVRLLPETWTATAVETPVARPTGTLRKSLNAELLGLETPLIRIQGVDCELHESDTAAELNFAGATVRGPRHFAPIFGFIAETTRFRPCDLPKIDANYDRLEVARRLVSDGLFYMEPDS